MPKAALNLIFLCVWSEAYAGMQDGAAGLFLCVFGEGWRYPKEG